MQQSERYANWRRWSPGMLRTNSASGFVRELTADMLAPGNVVKFWLRDEKDTAIDSARAVIIEVRSDCVLCAENCTKRTTVIKAPLGEIFDIVEQSRAQRIITLRKLRSHAREFGQITKGANKRILRALRELRES